MESGDNVWYFFCSPRYKYRNSKRKNRVTNEGYWKPTGKPRDIVTTTFDYDGNENEISGSRQTLVFYLGRVGNGDDNKTENKTPWVIHELALNLPNHVWIDHFYFSIVCFSRIGIYLYQKYCMAWVLV